MDDPERYSGKDGSLSVNGEFVTVDEYVLLKLRNCEIKKQNKMLRDCLFDLDHALYGYKNPPQLVKTAIDNAQKALEETK